MRLKLAEHSYKKEAYLAESLMFLVVVLLAKLKYSHFLLRTFCKPDPWLFLYSWTLG